VLSLLGDAVWSPSQQGVGGAKEKALGDMSSISRAPISASVRLVTGVLDKGGNLVA